METTEGLHSVFHCTRDPGRIIWGQTVLLHPIPTLAQQTLLDCSMAAARAPNSFLTSWGVGGRLQNQLGSQRKPTDEQCVWQHPHLTGTHTLNEPPQLSPPKHLWPTMVMPLAAPPPPVVELCSHRLISS